MSSGLVKPSAQCVSTPRKADFRTFEWYELERNGQFYSGENNLDTGREHTKAGAIDPAAAAASSGLNLGFCLRRPVARLAYARTLATDNDRLTATPVYPRRRDSRFRECALCDREARLGGRFVRSNFIFLHASIRKPACSVCRSTLPVVPGRVVIKDVKSKTASRLVNWE